MLKILLWGDSHIPYRASSLPSEFLRSANNAKPDIAICTGDLVRMEVLERIKDICEKTLAVRGNMDEGRAAKLPTILLLEEEGLRMLVFHGHGIYPRGDPEQLYSLGKKHGAEIILTGHTHSPDVRRYRDIVIVNPGSVCGVWGGGGGYGYPTWALLDIENRRVDIRVFEIRAGRVSLYEEKSFEL